MWVFFFGREKLFFFIFKLSVKWVLLVAVRHCCSCAELLSLLLFFFFFFFWVYLHLKWGGGYCCGSVVLRAILEMGSARFSRCRTMEALVAISCVLGMISLSCATRMESGSRQKLEVQKHLRRLNKPAVKTIEVCLFSVSLCFLFKWGFDSGCSYSVWFLESVRKWVVSFIFSGTKQGWMYLTFFPFLLK